jgi:hypothetical protein
MNRYTEGKQMTAGQPAGAPSAEATHWTRIHWRTVRAAVYPLQVRIAKAVQKPVVGYRSGITTQVTVRRVFPALLSARAVCGETCTHGS